MSDELRPALVVIGKRGKDMRYMVFADHNDALAAAKAFRAAGWGYDIIAVETYQQGELPPDVPNVQQSL